MFEKKYPFKHYKSPLNVAPKPKELCQLYKLSVTRSRAFGESGAQ